MEKKVKVNELHFQYQPKVSQDAFLVPILWLAQICDELSRRQAKFPRILSQNGQNDLEGQGQWPPFSIPTESIPWCLFGANLVISAEIYDELSCRQGKVYEQMDRRRQRQYPFGLKGQGVKIKIKIVLVIFFSPDNIRHQYSWHLPCSILWLSLSNFRNTELCICQNSPINCHSFHMVSC